MVKRVIYLFILSFLVVGCVPIEPNVFKKNITNKYPIWYTSLHKDNQLYFYGIGEGSSKKDAISYALNNIASKISISVESTYTTKIKIITTNQKENYTHIIKHNIKNEVSKIEFNTYEIQKYEKLDNDTHLVMVALNRIKSAEFKSQKIKTNIDNYKKELASNSENIVTKLKTLNKVLQNIETKTLPECYVVKILHNYKKIEDYVTTLQSIKNKISNYKNNITFMISGQNRYKNIIQEKLSNKGFSIVRKYPKIKIKIKTDETKLKVMDNYIYKSKVEITVSVKNKIVGKKILTIGAKSRTSYEQAREFGLIEFSNRLDLESILKELLGI